jgi:uncharacterized protein with von Willebrand factor type A (vWA) domain
VLEELVPVGLPVYVEETLSEEQTQRLVGASPAPQTRSDAEVREAIDDLFEAHETLQETLRKRVSQRRAQIAEERQQIREELSSRGDGQPTEWAEDIDQVAKGSFDVLAMTIYFPA